MLKRPLLVSMALAVGLALAGCAPEPAQPTPSATAGGGSTPTRPSPSSTPSVTAPSSTSPSPSTSAQPEAWTGETAYAACVAYHRDETTADGLDPDSATWNPYSPDVVRQNGSEWLVDLIGTVEDADGNTNEGVFSCVVAGTPAAPKVSESAGM